MNNTPPQPQAPTDIRRPLFLGLAALVLGLGGFLTWAALAPLNEGVPLPGIVVVESKRKTVQHLTGGMVAEIRVRDGDRVQENQLLLRLDMNTQLSQQQMLRSQLAGLQAEAAGLRASIPQRRQQIHSMASEIAGLQPLIAESLYPLNRYTEMQRQLAQLRSQLSLDEAGLQHSQAQIREQQERLALVETEIARAEIRAPSTGTVIGLTVHAMGAIVPAGGGILEIVPEGDSLIVEARIPPHLIENVRAGLPAQLRFTALDHRKTPVIEGQVALVSADLITDNEHNSFYQARITASATELSRLGNARLYPGMPVEAIVVTGERTLLNYLLKPLSDSFALGLKER